MKVRHRVEITATLELTREEIGALDALFGYGTDEFIEIFYAKLGKSYLQPYEAGIRSLATKVKGCANGMERLRQDAEKVLRGTHYPEPRKEADPEPYRERTVPKPPPDPIGVTTAG